MLALAGLQLLLLWQHQKDGIELCSLPCSPVQLDTQSELWLDV
jgi:hypothetical protein